jgi:diguanylate cyclase (GGDEF)-like protein
LDTTGADPAVRPWRTWPLFGAPRVTAVYLVLIDLLALVWCVRVLSRTPVTSSTQLAFGRHSAMWNWIVLALLLVLALAFEEGARRAARLKLRLSGNMKRDMTSVWCIAGAVAMPPAFAVMLLVPIMIYVWFRQQRPAGERLHFKVFNASTAIMGCLTAGLVVQRVHHLWPDLPGFVTGSVAVFVAIVVHAAVNRALVTVGAVTLGARGRALIGTSEDNLIELATLCLGGLVALAAGYQPWLAVLVIAPMVTLQRGALVRELETAATVDSKTGLLNAVAWEQLAQHELARARRESYVLAILIIDIDHFKLVNDRFGHLVGDAVLRALGKSLRTSMREYDTAGRFGGEEFVAVLPDADVESAMVVAERIRSRINQLLVSDLVDGLSPEDPMRLSVSVGVACLALHGDELVDLLHSADRALYQAKAGGRNRVMMAGRGDELSERISIS